MFIVPLLNGQKVETSLMSINWGMDKQSVLLWYINTMEYYPAIKKNEVLIHDTTQMNLENRMLCLRSQSPPQKKPHYTISFL